MVAISAMFSEACALPSTKFRRKYVEEVLLSSKKILVIDDEETIRFLLTEMLQQLGHEVEGASNKDDVVLLMHTTKFDLIFVDMVYANADYNGLDLIEIIKDMQPECQIVILTAKPSMDSAIKALRFRIFDYLEKPIQMDVLTSVVYAALAESHANALSPSSDSPKSAIASNVSLTMKETDILQMLAKGFSYAEVATHLECQTSTIQWHIKNIYKKLGVTSKSEAVYEALCMQLINIE